VKLGHVCSSQDYFLLRLIQNDSTQSFVQFWTQSGSSDSANRNMASSSMLKRRASSSPDHADKRIRLSPSHRDDHMNEAPSRIAVFESAEIFLHILSFLPVDDIINVERVSRYWRRMAEDGSLWRKMYLGKSCNGKSRRSSQADASSLSLCMNRTFPIS